jgi:hypothetical protein
MRLTALFLTLMLLVTACIGDDDNLLPEAIGDTPTVEATTPTSIDTAPSPTVEPDAAPASPEATPTDAVDPTPTPVDPDPSPTVDDEVDDDELAQTIERIADETSDVRGLPLLEDINIEIIDREQLRANLLALLEDDYGQEQADLDRDALWILRLIPDRELDYLQLQIDLFTEQVAGYYDSETGELFVIGEGEEFSADEKVTASHEITHALQDQHFGLDRYDEDDPDFDRQTAFQSVYEGDATWTMIQWAVTNLSMAEISEFLEAGENTDSETFDNAPRYVRDSLLFPYNAGFAFVEELIRHGDLEALDSAMEDPPVSTEQILHPEKYINEPRDLPLDVEIPDLGDALGEEWEEVYEGSAGEFDLRILLEENRPGNARDAVEGWGGAWFVTYQSGDDLLVVLSTRWDTAEDAAEFEEALLDTMVQYEQDGNIWFDGERYHTIFAGGDSVVLTTSTDRDALQAALDAQ